MIEKVRCSSAQENFSPFSLPVLQGGDHCTSSDKCLDGMSCIGGLCTCIQGRLTSDRRYCLRANEKLLGESCDAFTDRCYQLNQGELGLYACDAKPFQLVRQPAASEKKLANTPVLIFRRHCLKTSGVSFVLDDAGYL